MHLCNSWATPCKKYKIQTFKPFSTQVDNQYNLNLYERNVQVRETLELFNFHSHYHHDFTVIRLLTCLQQKHLYSSTLFRLRYPKELGWPSSHMTTQTKSFVTSQIWNWHNSRMNWMLWAGLQKASDNVYQFISDVGFKGINCKKN